MIKEYPKGTNLQLSEHFNARDFDCRCKNAGCSKTLVDEALVDKLQHMRNELGYALTVESGYRCRAYQLQLQEKGYQTAKGISPHEQGKAADIHTRGQDSGEDLEQIARASGFTSVGVARVWVHVDTRPEVLRWTYSDRPLHLPAQPRPASSRAPGHDS